MTRLIPALIIGALLLIPLGLLPFRSDEVNTFIREMEKRKPHPFPEIQSLTQLANQKKYNELGSFLSDRYPLRDLAIPGLAKFNYEILKKPHLNGVDRGRNGDWLFLHSSLNLGYQDPASAMAAMEELQSALETFAASQKDHLAKVTLVVAPDKASIYTEELSDHSLREYERFRPARERFHEIITGTPGIDALDSWALYRQLKTESNDRVYLYHDTHHMKSTALTLAKAIVTEISEASVWPDAAYSREPTFYEHTHSDLTDKAGLWSARERVQRHSTPSRSSEIYLANEADGTEIQLQSGGIDWGAHSNETIRLRSRSDTQPLVSGRVLFIHDSFVNAYRQFLVPYFSDITFAHVMSASACEMQDAVDEYDHIIVEASERNASKVINRILSPCSTVIETSLDMDHILDMPIRGSSGQCSKPGPNGSWTAAGWILVGTPLRKAEEVFVVDVDRSKIVSGPTIWRGRPDLHNRVEFGPARFDDIGFLIDSRYLPENFDLLALADGELYRVRTGDRCQKAIQEARASAHEK